jgi:hypothetical protein
MVGVFLRILNIHTLAMTNSLVLSCALEMEMTHNRSNKKQWKFQNKIWLMHMSNYFISIIQATVLYIEPSVVGTYSLKIHSS